MTTNTIKHAFSWGFLTLCAAVLCAVAPCAAADSLDDALAALAAYDFGASHEPVIQTAAAVRAVAAGRADAPCSREALENKLVALITGEATVEAKRFVCRMLGEIGDAASAAPLAALLEQPELFQTALTALENNPSEAAAQALVAALDRLPGEQEAALLMALGRQGHVLGVAALAARMQGQTPTALIAAQALADMKLSEACDALMKIAVAGTPDERRFFAAPCLRCAAQLPADKAAAVYEPFRSGDMPVHIRMAAVSGLMQSQPERAQALVLEALQDGDPAMAHQALALARLGEDNGVSTALAQLLGEAAAERKPALIELLADLGDAGTLPAILAQAEHENADVRRAVLRAAAVLGNADQTAFLLEKTNSGAGDEQRLAKESLVKVSDPAVNERLVKVAADTQAVEALRTAAISALAERRANASAEMLLNLAKQDQPAVRAEAVSALRVLARGEQLPALVALAAAPNLADIRDGLPQALAQTAARIPDAEARADAVIAAISQAGAAEQTALLLDVLGLIGGNRAFDTVRGRLDDGDSDIRRAAIAALTRFQRVEALELLQSIVMNESDAALRAKAFSGYMTALRNAAVMASAAVQPHVQTAFDQAKSKSEKREFLAAATQLPSLDTLNKIAALVEDPDVSAEAARAALRVCTALVGAYPQTARTHLNALVARTDVPAPLVEDAKRALTMLDQFDGYITAWEMAGPYFEDQVIGDALFDREFPPEKAGADANWRLFPLLSDANPAWLLEPDRVLGGEERVVFLRTKLISETADLAMLELGTNDGCRVWWNGTLIHAVKEGRPLTPGQDKIPVQVNAGANDLMIAVFQQGGAWQAAARLVNAEGKPLAGVKACPSACE